MRWLQYDNYASGHIAYIGSAPRLAEDVASLVPVFPSRHSRESALWRPVIPQTDWTPFFGVTVFTHPRFFLHRAKFRRPRISPTRQQKAPVKDEGFCFQANPAVRA